MLSAIQVLIDLSALDWSYELPSARVIRQDVIYIVYFIFENKIISLKLSQLISCFHYFKMLS